MIVGRPLETIASPGAPTHVAEMLEAAARAGRGGVFLLDAAGDERWHPWAEIHRRAEAVARALCAVGVEPGDTVAIVLPTCLGFLDAFWGVTLAGAAPVPLYPPLRLARLDDWNESTARLARVARVAAIVTDAKLEPLLGTTALRARPRCGVRRIEALVEDGASMTARLANRSPEELALVQYSSGSTREPRPIALSHHNLLAQCAILQRCVTPRLGPDVVPTAVSWLPLYHDMGLIGLMLGSAYVKGTLVLMPPEVFLVRPRRWLEAITRHRAHVSASPDFGYALTTRRLAGKDTAGLDLSSWMLALNGAEVVSAQTMSDFAQRFAHCGFRREAFAPVYGLAEASLAVTFPGHQGHADQGETFGALELDADVLAAGRVCLATAGATHVRSVVPVGQAVDGTAIRIVGDKSAADTGRVASSHAQRCELADGLVGHIQVRGPSVMSGYLQARETAGREGGRDVRESELVVVDGWLDTGDLGFLRDGQLYVTGRAKELIIVRGKNYAPAEFEHCVRNLEGVRPGGVVAVARQTSAGDQVLIFAERSASGRRSDAELVEDLARTIVEHTGVRPDQIHLVHAGALPRTSSGKLRRLEALRRHQLGELDRRVSRVRWGVTRVLLRSWLSYAGLSCSRLFRRVSGVNREVFDPMGRPQGAP